MDDMGQYLREVESGDSFVFLIFLKFVFKMK